MADLLSVTCQTAGIGRMAETQATAEPRRKLEPGWQDRHARMLLESQTPSGKIRMTYADGTPVIDRRGRPRIYSMHVDAACQPRRTPRIPKQWETQRAQERQAARAADAARLAAETAKVRHEARLGLVPPPGRLCAVDTAALLIIGPLGAIGGPAALLRSLAVLAEGERHPIEALVAAGPWRGEAALAAALDAARPRLAAIGLRICRRKSGWRLATAAV